MEVWWVGTDASVRDAYWYAPRTLKKNPNGHAAPKTPAPKAPALDATHRTDKKPAQGKTYRVRFWHKADMAIALQMSAYDPKRTWRTTAVPDQANIQYAVLEDRGWATP